MDKQDTMIAVVYAIVLVIGALNIDRLMGML